MIIFDLRCAPLGHVFEAWFASSAAFADQQGRGLVSCPLCGSADVSKAPMAPAVPTRENRRPSPNSESASPGEVKYMLKAAAAAQKQLLERSEPVGDRFADEARAIHLGEAQVRPIHGEATAEQAASLLDEGVPIAPLPFRIVPPGEEN